MDMDNIIAGALFDFAMQVAEEYPQNGASIAESKDVMINCLKGFTGSRGMPLDVTTIDHNWKNHREMPSTLHDADADQLLRALVCRGVGMVEKAIEDV